LVLNGDLSELERLAEAMARFCRDNSLGADVEFDLNLALEELFANSVKHGGCQGMNDAVEIQLEFAGGSVRVEYADRGVPFDPVLVPPPDLSVPLRDRAAGGLGLHLVKRLMQTFEYRRAVGWNRITMRRQVAL
jgi:serine/threonine-protein kinase RsbW